MLAPFRACDCESLQQPIFASHHVKGASHTDPSAPIGAGRYAVEDGTPDKRSRPYSYVC